MINLTNLTKSFETFKTATPFNHCIVDNFFQPDVAQQLEAEFLDYDSDKWFCYKNALEDKKVLVDWSNFPKTTYSAFQYLNSHPFVELLGQLTGNQLYPDSGLHGGGWHIHGTGGNLNPHLDYNIHPKLGLQRKLNIIVYMSSDLKEEHGGHLGLWATDAATHRPNDIVKEVAPVFNRAIIFDTTQNSWHGMSRPLVQPEGIYRKSLAIYYLCQPPADTDPRGRALYAPREDQKNIAGIEQLITLRAGLETSKLVYRK
jgi:hypothetical protein